MKHKIPTLGKLPLYLLATELPLILLACVVLLVTYLQAERIDPVGAGSYYSGMLEYIISALCVSVCSAFLVDTVLRYEKKE